MATAESGDTWNRTSLIGKIFVAFGSLRQAFLIYTGIPLAITGGVLALYLLWLGFREAPGMERPYHVWAKSPALSGMAFLVGHPDSAWNNSLLLGALAGQRLIRLSLDGERIVVSHASPLVPDGIS